MTGPCPEKGQFIRKCFTFARDRPVSNNKLVCPTISIETVIICSAGTQTNAKRAYTNTAVPLSSTPQPSAHLFYAAEEQTLRLEGGFVLPPATGGKNNNKHPRNNCSPLLSPSCSESVSQPRLFFSHAPTWRTAG